MSGRHLTTPVSSATTLVSRRRAEALVSAAHKRGRIETVIVRLGLVCGVGASVLPAHVCQRLAREAG